MPRPTLIAPTGIGDIHNDQVINDNRRSNPAAIASESAIFFRQGFLPKHLAIAAETEEQSLHAMSVNVARFFIQGQIRPADTTTDDIAQEDVEAIFPNQLAGCSIQA